MVTKTLTIMEDAYKLMAARKLKGESFSDEVRRIFSGERGKNIENLFGILTHDEAKKMRHDLEEFRNVNIALLKKRLA